MARKALGLAAAAFALFYALNNPSDAAGLIRDAADGVIAFFTALGQKGT